MGLFSASTVTDDDKVYKVAISVTFDLDIFTI